MTVATSTSDPPSPLQDSFIGISVCQQQFPCGWNPKILFNITRKYIQYINEQPLWITTAWKPTNKQKEQMNPAAKTKNQMLKPQLPQNKQLG